MVPRAKQIAFGDRIAVATGPLTRWKHEGEKLSRMRARVGGAGARPRRPCSGVGADQQGQDAMDRQEEFVLRTLEERDIRFVRLWFTDVLGFL